MSDPDHPLVQVQRDGDIAIVTLDHPARLNPISAVLQTSLRRVLADLAADNAVRAMQAADPMHAMTNRPPDFEEGVRAFLERRPPSFAPRGG